jgi:chromosome segregation ATPase
MGKLQELVRGYWWIALFIVGGWFWLNDHDNIIRNSVKIKATADSVTQEVNKLKVDLEIMRKADSIANIRISSLRSEVAEKDKELKVTKAVVSSLSSRLANALPDSLKPLFDSLQTAHQQVIDTYEAQKKATADIIALQNNQLVAKDSIINRQQVTIDSVNSKFQTLVKHQSGTLGHKAIQTGVKVLALYGTFKILEGIIQK